MRASKTFEGNVSHMGRKTFMENKFDDLSLSRFKIDGAFDLEFFLLVDAEPSLLGVLTYQVAFGV